MRAATPVIFDHRGQPMPLSRAARRARGQAQALLGGFKGANDENLADWIFRPVEINEILRNDLPKLRARCRDLAINDDTTKRYLGLLKQNVLGHRGIVLQAKNRKRNRKLDKQWNAEIEREWKQFGRRRRLRGQFAGPTACGSMTWREFCWLLLMARAIDGEVFIQVLKGYPHNKHRFAVRLLNPDLCDSSFSVAIDAKERGRGKARVPDGHYVEMGVEFDEFDRAVAYHFNAGKADRRGLATSKKRIRIPADQIIHHYRKEFVGQKRGIPEFAAILHKTKMLNGVNEAMVVGWRVAAAKMGFLSAKDAEGMPGDDGWDEDGESKNPLRDTFDATPGSIDVYPGEMEFNEFNPDYPSGNFSDGFNTFMRQISNGLNTSSPTLANDYSQVNYSSLRQAALEDREGWRCVQAEEIDGAQQPIFDDWYDWTLNVTGRISIAQSKRQLDPELRWRPRGWAWIDPLKEGRANIEANEAHLRTRQDVMAETSGADFYEVVDELTEERDELAGRELISRTQSIGDANEDESESDDE